jgi:hypothetical protein
MAGILPNSMGSKAGFMEKGMGFLKDASASYAQQTKKNEIQDPAKTAGGALMGAAGGAAAGSAIMPGWGTAIGAVVGLAGYMMG